MNDIKTLQNVDTELTFDAITAQNCKSVSRQSSIAVVISPNLKLWKSCCQHHTFFRLASPPPTAPRSFFTLGVSRHNSYRGRTEYQTIEQSKSVAPVDRHFTRNGLPPVISRSAASDESRRRHSEQSPVSTSDNMPPPPSTASTSTLSVADETPT